MIRTILLFLRPYYGLSDFQIPCLKTQPTKSREADRFSCTHRKDVCMENTRKDVLPENHAVSLSDFALFLSVMKNQEAYQCVLSIIMDQADLKLSDVKVEQVILNKSGKRAIRLDAWAVDQEMIQYNIEMQNDTESDNLRKRARFYQSMIDSPILKSGKRTKYKYLPPTVVIFITQEDIFGKDLAMYTFLEKCEEVADLYLDDGTKKIFLNMESKNGREELVSLLQYMERSSLENPGVIVKDPRILRLDEIVTEVKQSEEWEENRMNIYQAGIARGRNEGIKEGTEQTLIKLVKQNLLNVADAAKNAGLSEADFLNRMEEMKKQ